MLVWRVIFVVQLVVLVNECSGNKTEYMSAAANEIQDKFNDIKNPDDVKQIRDWKKQCRERHGEEAVAAIEQAPNQMGECVLQYIKPDKLQVEVNKSIDRGNLDRVFKKYCGYREDLLACVDTMLGTMRVCMTEQQLTDVNITRKAVDAAIDFTCHDDGDRIALFMAEDGQKCLTDHKDEIRQCVEEKVPEIREAEDSPESIDINSFLINEEQCTKALAMYDCVVDTTSKCEDPTPANILESLMQQMLKVTPCYQFLEARDSTSSASSLRASSFSLYSKNCLASIGPILYGLFSHINVFTDSLCSCLVTLVLSLSSLLHSLSSLGQAVTDCGSRLQEVARNSFLLHECCSFSGSLVILLAAVTAANLLL